jgi:hypothetical protein
MWIVDEVEGGGVPSRSQENRPDNQICSEEDLIEVNSLYDE